MRESGKVRENLPQKVRESQGILSGHVSGNPAVYIVGYLTLVSDRDLAPGTNQFVASPPISFFDTSFLGMCLWTIPPLDTLLRCPEVVKI